MINSNSGKHARKVTLDAAVSNAIAKAVDARKVAAFTVGAAGVLAGAAFAFGATPAMASENGVTPDTKTAPVTADENAGADKKSEDGKNTDAKPEVNEDNDADNKGQAEEKSATDNQAKQSVVNAEGTDVKAATYAAGAVTDRAADPAPAPQVNSEITISKETKDNLPNMYAWGSTDNTYIEKGQNQSVTFKFTKPSDGSTITKVAIFPSDGNTVDNTKSRRFLEYYSDSTEHQPYSGEYAFATNPDGSVTLTMNKLYRNNNMAAEKYAANRCIYVYGMKDGKEVLLYKTNIARAATLVPPKTAGSIVLKYNQELTAEQIQNKLKDALDAPTEATGKQSIREQITAASTSKGVGVRNEAAKTFTNTPDTAENKVIINDQRAYMQNDVDRFNRTTSKQGATETTYITTVQTLKTHLITDTGYTSDDLPLTVARYDDRIQKPIVEDLTNVSDEVKTEIKRKLAHLNHVSEDSVVINDDNTVTINFNGVDEKDAPKIKLSDLVLKKLKDGEYKVPTGSEAVFVANPLGYSKAEIERIKQAIFDANKENKDLGLTSKDQITLSYITGDTTVGHENIGISNGQAENTITVKIKTDKAVAEFTSNVKESKLTKLPNIRTDYDVTWTNTKIDGRDTDKGISWSNDQKTTIIYRYDPTKAQEFDTTKILGLLTATPKDNKSGLRTLNGGETLAYEGTGTHSRKSHMNYALQNEEPTGELTLGNMGGAYWSGNQKVSNSDVDLGDNLSIAGSYSWDPEAGPVTVAGKKDKIFKARLFVEPYAMTYYKDVYLEKNRHPGNTAKAINVIFVPQTNHTTSDLSKSIDEHKTENVDGKDVPTQSKYYNASDKVKSDYDDALKVAKALYDQVKDTKESDLTEKQKADIDNATIKLDKARAALDGDATKKEELKKSIEVNGKAPEGQTAATPGTVTTDKYKNVTDQAFQTDDGQPDTKKNGEAKAAKDAYDKALAEAEKVNKDANATQKAVDAAKAKLDAARKELDKYTTNKDKLNAAIAEHGKVNTGKATETNPAEKLKTADPAYQNATDAEREAYDNAVKKANDLLADPNASQKDVNAAITALENAKKALDLKATDKSKLITAEKLTFDNPDKTDANKQSTFYKNAKTKADGNDQAAKTAVENYDNALAKAREVLKNDKATQKEVDDAKDALTNAEKVLHEKYATDADELTKVLADNFSGYLMPAYFNAFDKAHAGDADAKKAFEDYNDAYQKAKELKKKLEEAKTGGTAPTQPEINAAKTALEKARTVIDKYATNTSRLSAAVFNDIAIQHSPAYKNVSETDASAEAKAAKDRYDKAVEKLHQALNKNMPKDKQGNTEIPTSNPPEKNIDVTNADALKNIQAHAQGEPLDRDVDAILKEMNDAAKELNKFATKTDKLLESINKDTDTQKDPAYKNTKDPAYKKANEPTVDDTEKNGKASAAKKAYDEALKAAKELLKNPAATQKEVNDALKKLDAARTALDAYKTDVSKLQESADKHGKEKQSDTPATEGTVTSDAYRNASDPHFMKADKTDPTKLVEDTEKNNAAKEAKKAYDKALAEAQDLLKKADTKSNTPLDAQPTQKQIDEALTNLDKARTEIEKYKTVTTDLEKEINKSTAEHAPAVTESDFENTPEFKNANDKNDNEDVKTYNEALKKARDLVKAANPTDPAAVNSSHPTQQEINDALDALKAAKKQITDNYKTNLEPLTSAKDFAGGDFKNTPEYKNAAALKDNQEADADKKEAAKKVVEALDDTVTDSALKKAMDIIDNPTGKTQKEVDAALKTLQEAMDAVTNGYKTKTDKLENEVGDKDAQGNPVTPKFEESVAYKNALAKKNAESEEDAKKNDSATKKLADYNEKLKAAQDLIAQVNSTDPNADPDKKPTQARVDAALKALQEAKNAIKDAFTTKVDALKKETKELKEDGGAKEDKDKFENSAEFKNALAKKDKEGKNNADIQAYNDALAKANDFLALFNEDGTPKADIPAGKQIPTQQEVDAALDALKAAKKKITDDYKTDPSKLKSEADKDSDFTKTLEYQNAQANGDDESKKALEDYKKALEDANKVLGDKDATQAQVDEALKKLQAAKKKLTDSNKTDKSKLQDEADGDAKFRKSLYFIIGKRDDIEAYKKALAEADSVLNDPNATQAQVDEALRKLQAAKYKLNHPFGAGSGVGSGSGYDTDADAGDGFDTSDSQSASVDKTALQVEVNNSEADSSAVSKSNTAAAKAYVSALAEAKRVLADKNATQAQVDEALRKLQAAKAAWRNASGASGNASGLAKTGAATGLFASLAAVFSGLGAAGVASRRRKHSNE